MQTDRLPNTLQRLHAGCFILALLCLCSSAPAVESKTDTATNASEHWSRWVQGQDAFPVGAWTPGSTTTPGSELRQRYLDAGFTLMPVSADTPEQDIDARAVPVITWDRKADTSAEQVLPTLAALKGAHRAAVAFLGQEIEPGSFQSLGTTHQTIYQDPDTQTVLPLASLFPNWFLHFGRYHMTYQRYVQYYIKRAQPAALMTTHFALLGNGTDRLWFYDNLETLRRHSLDAGIGLIGQVQSVGHGKRYRTPSDSDIRWQVNSYIAYGAKGLWHYYFSLGQEASTDGLFTGIGWYPKSFPKADPGAGLGGLEEGVSPPQYHTVKNINQHLHAIWPVLKNLRSVGVYHTDSQPPLGTTRLQDRTETSIWRLVGEELLVGVFENTQDRQDKSVYLYIVNKQHGNPSEQKLLDSVANLELSRGYTAKMIGHDQANAEISDDRATYRLSMPGGSGVLLRLVPTMDH